MWFRYNHPFDLSNSLWFELFAVSFLCECWNVYERILSNCPTCFEKIYLAKSRRCCMVSKVFSNLLLDMRNSIWFLFSRSDMTFTSTTFVTCTYFNSLTFLILSLVPLLHPPISAWSLITNKIVNFIFYLWSFFNYKFLKYFKP